MRTDSSPITIVTGTDTGVGKTVATALLAAHDMSRGVTVAVCKPAQTGLTPEQPGDLSDICYLSGIDESDTFEFVRLAEPLAPTTAARRCAQIVPAITDHAHAICELSPDYSHVLVEGAGGLLVGLDAEGSTLLDLADQLRSLGKSVRFVVVVRAGLGSLNHTALTCDAIRARGHRVEAIIIGSRSANPDLAEQCNLIDLPDAAGAHVLAELPAGLGADPANLRDLARSISYGH